MKNQVTLLIKKVVIIIKLLKIILEKQVKKGRSWLN